MQDFFINKNSVNPVLRMELIADGKYDYKKSYIYNNAIQDATVTFSMRNTKNKQFKISKAKAEVIEMESGCETKHILQYSWKKKDVNEIGTYQGWFEINFNGDIKEDNIRYPKDNIIVPIEDELIIHVK